MPPGREVLANTLRARAESFSLAGVSWNGSAAEAAGDALARNIRTWLNEIAEQYDYLSRARPEDLCGRTSRMGEQAPERGARSCGSRKQMQNAANRQTTLIALEGVAEERTRHWSRNPKKCSSATALTVTGKGILGVPKPPAGAAPSDPCPPTGIPVNPSSRPNPWRRRPVRRSVGRGPHAGPGKPPAVNPAGMPQAMDRLWRSHSRPHLPAAAHPLAAAPPRVVAPPQEAEHPSGGGIPVDARRTARWKPGDMPKLPTDPSLKPAAAGGGGAGGGGGAAQEAVAPAAVRRRRRCSRR